MNWVNPLLIVINVAAVILLAPLLNGFERKVRARVQRRVGPPVTQTVYDLAKLYSRGLTRQEAAGPFHSIAPYMVIASAIAASSLIPTLTPSSTSFAGDIIVLIYLLTSIPTITAFGAASSGTPYGVVGGWREASISMASELALAAAIAAIACDHSSLTLNSVFPAVTPSVLKPSAVIAVASIAVLSYIDGLRLPFDIPEAEPEIAGGVTIEYGGSGLALIMHSLLIKRLLLTSLFLDLAIPWGLLSGLTYPVYVAVRATSFVAALWVISLFSAFIEAISGRCRPGHALSVLKKVTIASGVALIAACVGM